MCSHRNYLNFGFFQNRLFNLDKMDLEQTGINLLDFQWEQLQQISYPGGTAAGKGEQACHAMIYAKTDTRFLSRYPCRAWVLMQMRFDGSLGFPGGFISDESNLDASLEDGLNRELVEELALDLSRCAFDRSHHVVSHFSPKTNVTLNFYAKEVTEEDFKEIEMAALRAEEYGLESFGLIRIPLFTMQDSHRGLPLFLQNQFAGASILQVSFEKFVSSFSDEPNSPFPSFALTNAFIVRFFLTCLSVF
jgi:8-oxo-dGTP pyrophosphatase MutT (NUDIX family)